MGLLAPLYALAAMAIAAPILFHLIRRQPRGQSEFSSLMFLQPSPPRLTRRSRLDNLFLLLLRALALCLIALAFARPFLRSVELADARVPARELLLMIDTSGSMQRTDVWNKAIETADKMVADLGKEDRVGLAAFDTELKVIVPLPGKEDADQQTASELQASVRSELKKLKPTYRGTQLAEQLMAAVELMQLRSTDELNTNEASEREIVLVSDLHTSSNIEALQGFDWPENVRLDVRAISSDKPGNAHASVMQASPDEQNAISDGTSSNRTGAKTGEGRTSPGAMKMGMAGEGGRDGGMEGGGTMGGSTVKPPTGSDATHVRIRVENSQNAKASSITLRWSDADAGSAPVTNLQVPAGQVRVVSVAYPNATASRLELTGDATDFDNAIYVPRTAARKEKLGYVGAKRDKAEDDLYFFLSQVPLSTLVREVETVRLDDNELSAASSNESLAGLVIECPITESQAEHVLAFAKTGRPAVVVLSRPLSEVEMDAAGKTLARLLDLKSEVVIKEATTKDFALLTDIDFRHPLFQPLADAKFNDFGKVRFWSHRAIELPDTSTATDENKQKAQDKDAANSKFDWRVLARFDDKSPALVHRTIGRGDLWLLTSGWQSTGSQLALSSKFVPLVFGMLDPEGRSMELDAIFEVGETVPVASSAVTTLTKLDGTPVRALDQDRGALVVEEPGLYYLTEDGKRRQIAIILPESESQLDPLDVDRFAQYGIITAKSGTAKERVAAARLSQAQELEGRQKLWRWILVGVIGLLIVETLVAGRLSHQT